LFDAFRKYFGWKKQEVKDDIAIDVSPSLPALGVDIGLPPKAPVLLRPQVPSESYIDNILNKTRNDVKCIDNTERGFMAEKFLVLIDTTGRPEVKDRGLKGGLKNFYFILANDENQARQMVLSTFARAPGVLAQLQNSIKVIPLNKIAPHVNEKSAIWSYIPLRKESK
jgi:hypothetical protein